MMGGTGFQQYFFSLMDGDFTATQMERDRQKEAGRKQGVPGELKEEENRGQIHREEDGREVTV